MKVNANELVKHIEKAAMGGLINELVLDEKMNFAVTDDAKSVLSISKNRFENNDLGKIGLFDLALVIRSIQFSAMSIFAENEDLDVKVVDNRLVFQKGVNSFKFLLSNPKVISSTVQNVDETLKKLRGKDGLTLALNKIDIKKLLDAITLITPELVTITIADGQANCLVGKESEHNTIICIGEIKSKDKMQIKLKPDLLSKLLQTLPQDEDDITVEIRDSYPIIFESKNYTFVIAPIKEE